MSVLWLVLVMGCALDPVAEDRYDFDRDGHHHIDAGGDDCNDRDANVHPSADEICGDGVDNNCDGVIDDEGAGAVTWYVDGDGDGYGVDEVVSCAKPDGAVADGGDCNDGNVDVHPGAAERCDGLDQDCDDKVDEGLDAVVQYPDADGDGYGDDAVSETRCVSAGDAWAVEGGDCDDAEAAVNPSATEAPYDGVDADCDGSDDFDVDGDGERSDAHGGVDCDDTSSAVHTGATEVCADGIDNNCDGATDDDGTGGGEWYIDGDGDGYGDVAVTACVRPEGSAILDGDCDDGDAGRNPGKTELCDGVDQDCIGGTDDGLATVLHYADGDGDGYGVTGDTEERCAREGDGWATLDGDCDDGAAGVNPGATEVYYDGVDGNCDGADDDDADGDGEKAEARGGADCDDTDAGIGPHVEEVCGDGVDADCAGLTEKCRFVESGVLGEEYFVELGGHPAWDFNRMEFVDLDDDGNVDFLSEGPAGEPLIYWGPLIGGTSISSPRIGFDSLFTWGTGSSSQGGQIFGVGNGAPLRMFRNIARQGSPGQPVATIGLEDRQFATGFGEGELLLLGLSDGSVHLLDVSGGGSFALGEAEWVVDGADLPQGNRRELYKNFPNEFVVAADSENSLLASVLDSEDGSVLGECHLGGAMLTPGRGSQFSFSDLDNDGLADCVIGFPDLNGGGQVRFGWGSEDGATVVDENSEVVYAPIGQSYGFGAALQASDIDGDKIVDLIVLNSGGASAVNIYLGPINATEWNDGRLPDYILEPGSNSIHFFERLSATDIDGDGVRDIVFPTGEGLYIVGINGD